MYLCMLLLQVVLLEKEIMWQLLPMVSYCLFPFIFINIRTSITSNRGRRVMGEIEWEMARVNEKPTIYNWLFIFIAYFCRLCVIVWTNATKIFRVNWINNFSTVLPIQSAYVVYLPSSIPSPNAWIVILRLKVTCTHKTTTKTYKTTNYGQTISFFPVFSIEWVSEPLPWFISRRETEQEKKKRDWSNAYAYNCWLTFNQMKLCRFFSFVFCSLFTLLFPFKQCFVSFRLIVEWKLWNGWQCTPLLFITMKNEWENTIKLTKKITNGSQNAVTLVIITEQSAEKSKDCIWITRTPNNLHHKSSNP